MTAAFSSIENIVTRADAMYDDPEHHTRADVAKLLRDGLTKSRHPALLWRTARALYDVANSKRTSASERVELLQEALGMVEESLQHLAGSHELYAAHKWCVRRQCQPPRVATRKHRC